MTHRGTDALYLFRPFEIYFVTTAIYLCLAILLRQVLGGIGWWLFPRRATR